MSKYNNSIKSKGTLTFKENLKRYNGNIGNIKALNLSVNDYVFTELYGIEECFSLEEINFKNQPIDDITPLFSLPNLKRVTCDDFDIESKEEWETLKKYLQ